MSAAALQVIFAPDVENALRGLADPGHFRGEVEQVIRRDLIKPAGQRHFHVLGMCLQVEVSEVARVIYVSPACCRPKDQL